MDATLRALNRFGLGARPFERQAIADPRAWLRSQLDGATPGISAPGGASPDAVGQALRGLRMLARGSAEERRSARQRLTDIATAETRAALAERVATTRPFVERLVAFWSNHLCVSATRPQVAVLAGSYERDVIRPHVLGRFEDMVLASARHPAMLLYLDNAQSIGPNSPGARAGGRAGGPRRGLNENYARELLELHTIGVDGGYSQQDVQELAKILTGWTVSGLGGQADRARRPAGLSRPGRQAGAGVSAPGPAQDGPLGFAFRELLHEPGTKMVLGQRYGAGLAEGERVIRALCRRPSTATFVAAKLVRHFVSDDPPAAAVERVARAFRTSDGNLRVVARALVDEPEAWREDARKFRTPQEWLVAVLRALDAREIPPGAPLMLRQLRQPLWSPPSPRGFGDALQDWADPDSLLNRGELARTISRLPAAGQRDPRSLLDVVEVAEADPLRNLLADRSIPVSDRIALATAGPAFQWR